MINLNLNSESYKLKLYPAQHGDIFQVESNVEEGHEIICKFKEDQFGNSVALKLRFRPMIF